jgi:flagellar basal body-associated protein FliL
MRQREHRGVRAPNRDRWNEVVMSEKKEKPPAGAPAEEKPAKKGLPVKMIGAVGVIMIVEAVVVIMFFGMIGPKKSHAAPEEHGIKVDDAEGVQDVLITEDKFQNLQQGKVWFWDTAVYVQVQKKNGDQVKKVLESRGNEIKEELGRIIGRAQPSQLREPDGQTLNRQFSSYLIKIFGADSEEKPLVEKVIVPKLRGIRGEY